MKPSSSARSKAAVLLVTISCLLPLSAQTWTQRFPANSPSGRCCFAMTYDDNTAEVVLFGGFDVNGRALGDTWTWNGTNWTQRFPANSPSPRGYTSMAYDFRRTRAVLFGGAVGLGFSAPLNDTWLWDGGNWTQVFPVPSPEPRGMASLAYDERNDQTVLFGGISPTAAYTDTWTWNGNNWTRVVPSEFVSLPGDLVWTTSENGVVRYDSDFVPNAVWSGFSWIPLAPLPSGPNTAHGAIADDPLRKQFIYFGGVPQPPGPIPYTNATWQWKNENWGLYFPNNSPPARGYMSMAYHKARNEAVLFGGIPNTITSGFLNDTWVWENGNQPSPTGLTAVAGDAQVLLRWSAPNPVPAEYRVYVYEVTPSGAILLGTWHTSTGLASHVLISAASTGNNIPLTNGHRYRFEVAAFGQSGESTAVVTSAVPGGYAVPAHPSRPVLFLHGINADASAWSSTAGYLSGTLKWSCGGTLSFLGDDYSSPALEYSVPDSTHPVTCPFNQAGDYFTSNFGNNLANYSDNMGIEHQGFEVDAFLRALAARGKLSLVAWSMGGLASRSYIESNPAVAPSMINDLTTLGTPQWGVNISFLRTPGWEAASGLTGYGNVLSSRGATDMDGGCVANGDSTDNAFNLSSFLYRLNVHYSLPPTIRYTHIAGLHLVFPDGCLPTLPLLPPPVVATDLIVPVKSSTLDGIVKPPQHWYGFTTFDSHLELPNDVSVILCALDQSCMQIQVFSPVDIEVTAPNGQKISKDVTSMPGAEYQTIVEADGHETASVLIPYPQPGQYSIAAVAKPTASPTDTFTIKVTQNGSTTTIADAMPVNAIPQGGFSTHVNAAPVANAGPSQRIRTDDRELPTVTLNGSASSDPNGLRLSYSWTDASGKMVGSKPLIRVKAAFGTTYYNLSVTDSAGLSASAQTSVTVVRTR